MYPHPGQAMQAAPPQAGPQQQQGDPASFLAAAMHALTQYVQAEPDPADQQAGAGILAELRQLSAKDRTDLAGGAPGPDALAAALAGQHGP